MIKSASAIVGIWIFLATAILANAQDMLPSTQPAAPHKLDVPPGFHIVRVGERMALCQPKDDPWVQDVLASVPPTTRPSTMPSDIIQNVRKNRNQLTSTFVNDMALPNSTSLDEMIDNKLLTELQKMVLLKPTVYYFVATRSKVADLMAAGWTDPQFYYIRFSHNVSYSTQARLAVDEPMGDLVWWVEIHDGDNVDTQRDELASEIKYFEAGLASELSAFSRNTSEHLFEDFIHRRVIQPLGLPGTLQWFDFAVSNVFAIKYAAMISNSDRRSWTLELVGRPGQPRPWARADLVNALDPSQVRPEYLESYDRALMFKGGAVIYAWITKSGDGVLAQILPLMRAHAPANPQEFIKLVKDTTGIDLTSDMLPDYGDNSNSAPAKNGS